MVQTLNNTTSATAGNKTKYWLGIGMSLEAAELLSFWANVFAIGALCVGVASAYLIWLTADVKEDALKRDLAVARDRSLSLEVKSRELDIALKSAQAKVLELEAQQAPRRLVSEQQDRIATAISRFKSQKFVSGAYGDDLESRGLWTTIDEALVRGGWQAVDHTLFAGVALIVGIDVEIAPSMTGTDVQFAAQALVEALIKEGMKASIDISRAGHNAQPDVIHVMVGKKPI